VFTRNVTFVDLKPPSTTSFDLKFPPPISHHVSSGAGSPTILLDDKQSGALAHPSINGKQLRMKEQEPCMKSYC